MQERPILFNPEMVRAILDGRKTQTRREIKKPEQWQLEEQGKGIVTFEDRYGEHHDVLTVCPFGKVGDRLWVREKFKIVEISQCSTSNESQCYGEDDYFHAVVEYADGKINVCDDLYIDECEKVNQPDQALRFYKKNGFSPNIHMPRWACRTVLEITDVRVDRLQDVSEGDSVAEGIERIGGTNSCSPWNNYKGDWPFSAPSASFESLWKSTGGNWDSNPWVWVIEFKRVEEK